MNNAAAMQAMQMQLGGPAAPRLRSSHVRASWTAVQPSCTPAFAGGHVSLLGRTQTTDATVITLATKANPDYGHRQPEEILT